MLKRGGYQGYFSLEWEKRWHFEMVGPEVAFPDFVARMKEHLSAVES
ncbi:MAG: hypothetical protein AB1898_17085 [Acidobacteriota bacterium]